MQFSEISELNNAIAMIRTIAYNSSSFHDRHDSEIDRLFNSSPPAAVNGDNKIMSMDSVQGSSIKGLNHSQGSKGENKKDNGNDDKISGQRPGAGGKTGCKTVFFKTKNNKYISKKSKRESNEGSPETLAEVDPEEGIDELDEEEDYCFVKEEIFHIDPPTKSELADLLKGSKDKVGGPVQPIHGPDAAILKLIIYLPTREEMTVELYEVSTVEEAIETILRTHRAEERSPVLYYGHPECYELRLHDQDGLPDEDFPALDRSRKIKNFGDAGGHEYCLCERPDVCPPIEDTPMSLAAAKRQDTIVETKKPNVNEKDGISNDITEQRPMPVHPANTTTDFQKFMKSRKQSKSAEGQGIIKIYMPNSDYAVLAIDSATTGNDLLPTLAKKHRLQLYLDEHVFIISKADQERLDYPTCEISLQTKLMPLRLQEVTLRAKKYADAPQAIATRTNDINDDYTSSSGKVGSESVSLSPSSSHDGHRRPPLETFMFNDITASMYKEWIVVKKNKYGKKQRRVFGIDQDRIYNQKVGERAVKARTTTKIAERFISTITRVNFLEHPCEFFVFYSEPEPIKIEYRTSTGYECAEIVARLRYLLSRRK